MRFEILELVKYDKTAAEILVDAVADNEVKFKLLNKVWNYIVTTTIVEKASQFKEVVADMYAFTGDDEVKLQLLDKTLERAINNSYPLQTRIQTAVDEASKLLSIVQPEAK